MIDDENPRWKCCCCCHVLTGATIIGVLEFLSAFGLIIRSSIVSYEQGTNLTGFILCSSITLLAVGLLFLGIFKERSIYLIMHMVIQVIRLIIYFVLVGFGIALAVLAKQENVSVVILILVAVLLLMLSVEIWFFVVILRAYEYLKIVQRTFAESRINVVLDSPPSTSNINPPPSYERAVLENTGCNKMNV